MKSIMISDVTLKMHRSTENPLTFKEKIEIVKLLDRLHTSVIELPLIENETVDTLLVKSCASVVTESILALPTGMTAEEVDIAFNALKSAPKPRLQVVLPLSPAQMEYVCHKKAPAMLEFIKAQVTLCRARCADVEFVIRDATRTEPQFLTNAIAVAIDAGATTVTLCDDAGHMLPTEFAALLTNVRESVPSLEGVSLGILVSDEMGMSCASAVSAILAGASEIKTAIACKSLLSSEMLGTVLRLRGSELAITASLSITEMQRVTARIERILNGKQSMSDSHSQANINEIPLNADDDLEAVARAVASLGYELSKEDMSKVYEAFHAIALKKQVSIKELDAIVATAALQVPPTYRLESYVINSGNVFSSSANIVLSRQGHTLNGVCLGDGPIDAAFLAIEQIVGHHYELDDFQIQSVTEGRGAIGSALVKLRFGGKLYSGQGVSTDIIGASIRAYLNALNKIVFEEN